MIHRFRRVVIGILNDFFLEHIYIFVCYLQVLIFCRIAAVVAYIGA